MWIHFHIISKRTHPWDSLCVIVYVKVNKWQAQCGADIVKLLRMSDSSAKPDNLQDCIDYNLMSLIRNDGD